MSSNNEGYGAGGEVLGAKGLGGDGLGQQGGEAITPTTTTQATTAAVMQQAASGGVTATGAKVGFRSEATVTGYTRSEMVDNDDNDSLHSGVESVKEDDSSLMEIDPNATGSSLGNPNLRDITFIEVPENINDLDVILGQRQ